VSSLYFHISLTISNIYNLLRIVEGEQPGPSSGQIRRPRDTAYDIADLYGRLQDLENTNRNWEGATARAMQEDQQDITRLESNADTQKKHFDQRLEAVNEVAKSAEEKVNGTQNQIDSVRQQTEYLHNSLVAAQKHTDKLTSGLSNVMERFNRMNFDLPNAFDDWVRVRLGGDGTGPTTVSGADLHRSRWSANGEQLQPPLVPPIPLPIPSFSGTSSVSQPAAEEENPPTPPGATSQSQSDTSPSKFFADYLHADQGQALGDLESELERQNRRSSSGGTRSSGSRGRQPSLESHWPNVAGQWERNSSEAKQKSGEEDAEGQIAEQPAAGEHAAEMRTAEEQMAEESGKTGEVSCQPTSKGLEVMEKKLGVEENSGGKEARAEEQVAEVNSRPTTEGLEDMDVETEDDVGCGGKEMDMEEGEIPPTMPSMAVADSGFAGADAMEEDIPQDSLPPSQSLQTVVVPPTPSSSQGHIVSSPAIVTHQAVHPPEGMLSSSTPPPSPPTEPDHRLLALPATRASDALQGPITRSRSRSRSLSNGNPPPSNKSRRRK
jgi:hypothetical protein